MHNIISIKNNDMLNQCKDKRTKYASNTILEQPSSDLQSNQENSKLTITQVLSKALPNIKINEKRIMTYNPLSQCNRNHSFNSTARYENSHHISKENVYAKMGKSTSISNFKQVIQKLNQTHSATRIKTELDKQNELKRFLPNKTLPSSQLKKAYSIQKQVKKPRYFQKSKNNYTNIDQTQLQITNFAQNHGLSKNKSFSKISSQMNGTLRQNDKIVEILSSMSRKQEYVAESRAKYERKIKELKTSILEEKMLLALSQKNYQTAVNDLKQKEQYERQSLNESLTSVKKRQNIQIEVKAIRGVVIDASLENKEVLAQIKEEKQLINSYNIVIQELKHQLKIETQEKMQLQKNLIVFKKSQKIHALKKTNQSHVTQDLVHTIYSSLKKWV